MSGFYDKKMDGTEVHYVDFDFNLNIHPVTKDFVLKTNEKAIMQSLRNCVMAASGDFVMENDIGGGVDDLLFSQNNALIAFNARRRIEETINNHEKRIELNEVKVYRTSDYHGLVFEVSFFFANNPTPTTETIKIDRRR